MTTYVHGVDISSHQPGWTPEPDDSFVFIKATEGRSYTNPEYEDQIATARDAGLVVGHYHWLNDGSVQDQVDYFLAIADIAPGDMIACDWEDSSNPSTAQKDEWIETVKQRLGDHHRVGLYCNRDWWLNHDTSSYAGDFLWIANYTTADDPGIEYEWLFWQYTDKPIDQNHGRFDDVAALRAWAGISDGGEPGPDPADDGAWFSTDYLKRADDVPSEPSWGSSPYVILDDPTPDPDRNVSYLQACVRVAALDTDDGEHFDACYIVGQDYENSGDLRFGLCRADGTYADQWMKVSDGGHGQTFHAYRSAAGNLYVWCGEDPAYRYKWQSGKTVSKSSGDKMDFKGARPVGSYEPYVGFRDATDTKETLYLFDRSDFTDGTNRSTPIKSVTISKQTKRSQQSWSVSEQRIYRLSGATNDDPPHGSMLHVLEVFDWSGKLLLTLDVTAMSIESSSDEPEGLTFSGTPGNVLAGKREGSTDPKKRSYPVWELSGLP